MEPSRCGHLKVTGPFGQEQVFEECIMYSVGPGWFNLVRELGYKLDELGWNHKLFQVKEKFGGLRFYIDEGTQEMFDLIEEAQMQSLTICEFCGSPGTLREERRWLKTLCDECVEERENG